MIFKTNPDEIQNYLIDTSGLKSENIQGVFIPENYDEVSEVLKKANETKTQVTVSGNGTGTTGGRIAKSGFLLGTDKLNKIPEINKEEKFIRSQPGVILRDLQNYAEEFGLMYPPDPTERNAFVGGTIATNASGARTYKYGSTRVWVEEITVILPQGDKIIIRRGEIKAENGILNFKSNERSYSVQVPKYKMPDIKHAAGYFASPDMDLIDLFIGSEGTLGVIVEAKLKLIPKIEKIFSGVLFFSNESHLLAFVDSAIGLSEKNKNNPDHISACSIEFFDEQSLTFLSKKYPQTPSGSKGAILFEQECNSKNEEQLLEEWFNLAVENEALIDVSWFAQNQKDLDFFKEYRHALPSQINEFLSRNNVKKISSDIAVPGNKFRDLMRIYHDKLDSSPFKFVIFGHIGNYHLHTNILPHNETEFIQGKEVYKSFIDESIKMGGTISAEHGVGKVKVPYLVDMLGETGVRQMAAIKKALDPNNVLGIGTLIPAEYLN